MSIMCRRRQAKKATKKVEVKKEELKKEEAQPTKKVDKNGFYRTAKT